MNIPSRIIEGICNSELKAEDFYAEYGKEEINTAVENLRRSNIEILNKYTPEAMKAAVEAKLNKTNAQKKEAPVKKNLLSARSFRIVSYAAAAVFVAAIALPVSLNSYKAKTPQATERTKGGSAPAVKPEALNLYRQEGNKVISLANGDKANEGDIIQITYQAGQFDYGINFSVDGNGNITRHFPNNDWTAEKLKHGNDEIPLDFSYELDNAPDYECFIFVTSKKAFTLDDISRKIKNTKDLKYLTKFDYLPKQTEAISFVLEK